jgi:hypothetical protein
MFTTRFENLYVIVVALLLVDNHNFGTSKMDFSILQVVNGSIATG